MKEDFKLAIMPKKSSFIPRELRSVAECPSEVCPSNDNISCRPTLKEEYDAKYHPEKKNGVLS